MARKKKELMGKHAVFYVALYMRLSREDGDKDESDSIANQRKMLTDYIDSHDNYVLYSEYIDDGYSGTNFNRPDFNRMIQDIKNGEVNCVIVKDLSRFGRDYIDAGFYLERYFVDSDVRFISVTDHIDSFVSDYDMLMPLKNMFNAQYAKDISTKVQSSFKVKQRSGEFIGAFPSYGYKKDSHDRHKLIIDEYAASVVRRVFDLFVSGSGKIRIAKILNEEEILCPSAYKRANGENYTNCNRLDKTTYWTYSSIHKMLCNEMYIGNMVQGKTKRRMKAKAKPVDESEWIIVKDTHKPIIDRDTWDKVQNLLNRDTKQLDLDQNLSIFAGFLRCGDCDRALAKKLTKRKGIDGIKETITTYKCASYTRYGKQYCSPHKIEHTVLEHIILQDLKTIIQSIEDLQDLVKEQQTQVPLHSDVLKLEEGKLNTELEKTKKLKKSLYEDFKEGLLSKEDYLSYKLDYDEKESLLHKKIDSLSAQANTTPKEEIFDSPWVRKLLNLKTISDLDRNIVADMIDVIYIYEDNRIKIIYNFSDELEHLFTLTYKIVKPA